MNKCFSKRLAKRIRNLQAKFINTRIMTSIWIYVSASWGAVLKKMGVRAMGYENYLHDFVAV